MYKKFNSRGTNFAILNFECVVRATISWMTCQATNANYISQLSCLGPECCLVGRSEARMGKLAKVGEKAEMESF